MKTKILVVLMCVACVISLPLFAGGKSETADTSLAKIKEKGNFVLGLDDSFPPMGFRDDSGISSVSISILPRKRPNG
jgi:polar amino acid transport system substrate-binding protein